MTNIFKLSWNEKKQTKKIHTRNMPHGARDTAQRKVLSIMCKALMQSLAFVKLFSGVCVYVFVCGGVAFSFVQEHCLFAPSQLFFPVWTSAKFVNHRCARFFISLSEVLMMTMSNCSLAFLEFFVPEMLLSLPSHRTGPSFSLESASQVNSHHWGSANF